MKYITTGNENANLKVVKAKYKTVKISMEKKSLRLQEKKIYVKKKLNLYLDFSINPFVYAYM